ncbi:hypothetical protein ACVWXM_000245 [Bradyrhizobium sp. GM7.3]
MPCRTAAIIPIGTPMTATQIIVMVASKVLVSAPSAITDSTGAWKKIDRPRSPSSTWPAQVRYCRMIGWSRPSWCRKASIWSGVAVSPSKT